jgi:U3 small nucleolar RNA-associated protein 12
VKLQGHRSDVKSVTLSSDNSFLMSTSHKAVKIWNPSNGACLRTIESGHGLCGLIIPQNKYALVGSDKGTIEIIDVGSGTCFEAVEAHGGSIRSIAAIPNENGFVTGSADHDVKFWEYQIKQKSGQVCSSYVQLLTFLSFELYLIICYLGYLSKLKLFFMNNIVLIKKVLLLPA